MPYPSRSAKPRRQAAALPLRQRNGVPEVLLITSRETRRWIIPKGWVKKGTTARATATREAFEEAGVIGKVSKRAVGTFRYAKRMSALETVPCVVQVFLIAVEQQSEIWPEKTERRQRWFEAEAAARIVADRGLAILLRRICSQADAGIQSLAATPAAGRSPQGRCKNPMQRRHAACRGPRRRRRTGGRTSQQSPRRKRPAALTRKRHFGAGAAADAP